MKDAVATMGTILDETIQGRDAVHVAVIAVTAGTTLNPGERVGKDGTRADPVGIVDPFLDVSVKKGQRFWLFLYPRTITSLHHSWTHPAFEDDAPKITGTPNKVLAEAWLRNYCKQADGLSYDALIEVATTGSSDGGMRTDAWGDETFGARMSRDDDYLTVLGSDAHGDIPPEVWDHIETVTGKKVIARPTFYSCSC